MDTIESLRNGGIQIWMLTGDKIETATCIAISTGLKAKNQKIFEMKELNKWARIEKLLKEFDELTDTILIVDGGTLNYVLGKDNEKFFFEIVSKVLYKFNIFLKRLQQLSVAG